MLHQYRMQDIVNIETEIIECLLALSSLQTTDASLEYYHQVVEKVSERDEIGSYIHFQTAAIFNSNVIFNFMKQANIDIDFKNNFRLTVLQIAVQDNQEKVAVSLIKHGADPHVLDDDNHTLLHYAVANNNYSLVKFLLSQSIDVNLVSSRGATALMLAVDRKHTDIKLMLRAHGATVCEST